MTKRCREDEDSSLPAKRLRLSNSDRFSLLSDELLLRTLSYLSVSDLTLCERLSRRFQSLTCDLQLWKALFYNRFVRPRASRIPGLRDQETSARSLFYSSKISRWLDDDHLVRGKATNWKRQYKLRHNWSRGIANVSETRVAEQSSTPPLLVRLQGDVVVIADPNAGLRAWSLKSEDRLIASAALSPRIPTSLATSDAAVSASDFEVVIGFQDGGFSVYTMKAGKRRELILRYTHPPSTNGALHAIAFASPYLLTMTGEPLLSFYQINPGPKDHADQSLFRPPTLVSSLRSHTAYPPISLAIRTSSASVIASIAYAMPTWTLGWSVGLQEVRISSEGSILESRVASPLHQISKAPSTHHLNLHISPMNAQSYPRFTTIPKPTSLSYKHPYLLSTHSDNTLSLYMVTSNAEELSISAGHRLWGHTSSVSGAQVGDRGKAVSVSAIGNELRVWELEGGLASSNLRKRANLGEASVQVRSEEKYIPLQRNSKSPIEKSTVDINRAATVLKQRLEQSDVTKGWIAFDEEKVVLLREKMQGAQALIVYDFS